MNTVGSRTPMPPHQITVQSVNEFRQDKVKGIGRRGRSCAWGTDKCRYMQPIDRNIRMPPREAIRLKKLNSW